MDSDKKPMKPQSSPAARRDASGGSTWDRVLARIESKIPERSFNTWFKPTRFLREDAASLSVRVPNTWFAEWLRTNYNDLIEECLRHIDRPGVRVLFVPGDQVRLDPLPSRPAAPAEPGRPEARSGHVPLNPKYTFDTFVVSSCNQFAHAAARAVAEQPSRDYNPLYVYGGVGLGKTHLMQAIGNQIQAAGRLRMDYVSSEFFMNELINAIRFDKTFEFKDRFRNVDVLLIDDIQFLAGKERTQEEFFHTFNALHDAQKQIVITSDVPPREIPLLEERLRSRFQWGLIADMQPPDLETKVAILRKKAETEGSPIPDDVALFIASHCGSNVRELEGAFNKIVAYASMAGQPVTLDLGKQILRDLLPEASPATTVESIMKAVSNYFRISVSELKSRNNSPQITFPRQTAMWLCKKLTTCSLPELGRRFGGKHHSTVIHSIQKIEKQRREDKDLDRLLTSFVDTLR